jgi:hypothetical protein
MLGRISSFDLGLMPTHPDLAGGLGFLSQPSEAFGIIAIAVGAVVAGRWSTDVFRDGVPFLSLKKDVGVFAVLMTLLGILPLFPFTVSLFRMRLRAIREYGAFARDYCARFDEKWIHRAPDAPPREPLGTPDLQSLSDLANDFGIVARTSLFIATPRLAASLALASLVPMMPLFATVLPLDVIVPKLLRILV